MDNDSIKATLHETFAVIKENAILRSRIKQLEEILKLTQQELAETKKLLEGVDAQFYR